jgi:biotin synthase-like enzyme
MVYSKQDDTHDLTAFFGQQVIDELQYRSERDKKAIMTSITFLILALTSRCNLRCRYCYLDAGDTGGEEARLHDQTRLLAGARTINHLATAVCAANGAGIWMRPEGHQRWHEEQAGSGERCTFVLDNSLTRQKKFQDRVDFEILLK